jgi:hypothetical protein
MNKVIATSALDHHNSSDRFSSLPVRDLLRIRMKDLGFKNADLQQAMGFDAPNVISMMKTGSMRMPIAKTVIAARLLQVDPVFLLGKVIAENDPEMWAAIAEVMAEQLVTVSEMALLKMVRQGLNGHDVDLTQSQAFVAVTAPVLKATLERQNALKEAALTRSDD